MADRRLLHLRKQINALYRPYLRRLYALSTEAQQPTPTDQDKAAIIQKQDQKHLLDTQNHTEALITHMNKIKDYIASMPTTVQLNPNIPPYTVGAYRTKTREMPTVAKAAIVRAEHIRAHLKDLQYEPYPDRSQGSGAQWEKEVAAMSRDEREVELKSLQLMEEADAARIKRDSEMLVRSIKEIEAMGRRGVSLDEPARATSPFSRVPIVTPAPKIATKPVTQDTRPAQEATAKAKPAPDDTAKAKPVTLFELQKQLEMSYKKG
ncbi:hypothetical protein LTR36_006988 [Oleoguttula mirabilis]|uniref:Uncharacterized protein n=1 Tax=Oleoguttula mirabilis TaxID=1507867 RepID=A0AAV9JAV9_9PEZI|nr:hypothetical protein LTR36_006988 [Oleoguttula mirabilis]